MVLLSKTFTLKSPISTKLEYKEGLTFCRKIVVAKQDELWQVDCTVYKDKNGCYFQVIPSNSKLSGPINVTLHDKSPLMYNNTPPPCLYGKYLNLCTMYKIVHDHVCFPYGVFVPRATTLRSASKLVFHQPFARTSSFLHSFVPHTCALWNKLPGNITHACTPSAFKFSLTNCLYCNS